MIESDKKVTVGKIKDFFQLEQLTGDEASLSRWVIVPDINRPGFELTGYFKPTNPRRIVILGYKEMEYISHMSDEEQYKCFPTITDGLTPMLIISHNDHLPPILKEVAENQNFPIFRTAAETYRLTADLITFLDEQLAPEETLYGVLLSVYGRGVLLTGESGIGKSETALELIRQGQVLISDDRVDVQKIHNSIVGRAPDILKGMLELRGIGIIDIERMFGARFLRDSTNIDLVIHLTHYMPNHEYDRLGESNKEFTNVLNVMIPTINLPVSPGRSTQTLIETAVNNFILREEGYDSTEVFKNRLTDLMISRKSEGNKE